MNNSLNNKHREELKASGLSDETMAVSGIYSAKNSDIASILGWQPKDHDWGEGFVIPFISSENKPIHYSRVKLDFPRYSKQGKPIKYESPKKSLNHAYFPPGFHAAIKPGFSIVITEGEKKALACMQVGIPCIGLVGVWGWQDKRKRNDHGKAFGSRKLISDLLHIGWHGIEVIICFDSDAETNRAVSQARDRLAEALTELGATVRIAHLPCVTNCKTGLDDFLLDNDESVLRELFSNATPPELPDQRSVIDYANEFIDEYFRCPLGRELQWWNDIYYRHTGTNYEQIPVSELECIAFKWLDSRKKNARSTDARELVKALASICRVSYDVEIPIFLGKRQDSQELLTMSNGIFDIHAFMNSGTVRLLDHTPNWFSTTSLTYPFQEKAECNVWMETLHQIFCGDSQLIDLLAEYFGYCLTDDTSHQAILLLEGPPRSGKGTIFRAMQRVIGANNCCSPRLTTLSGTFGLWGLMGKQLALCSDAHIGHGDKAIGVLETLKLISGEDAVEIHRKNLPPITQRLRIKFALAVNELPKFSDSSAAMASRVLIIPLRKSFLGHEDITLEDKINREISGIFLWALDGLKRLREQGKFTQPDASVQALADFENLVSPMKAFLEDCCEIGQEHEVSRQDLWATWSNWCANSGHMSGSRELFGSRLRTLVPNILNKQRRDGGKRHRFYIGIQLLTG